MVDGEHAPGRTTERRAPPRPPGGWTTSTLRAMCSGSWPVCDGDEVLQWASLNGATGGSVRLLSDGAGQYLSVNPEKLARFRQEATIHGLTPPP